MKLLAFVCLLFLAGLGIGLSGGIPLPMSNKRKQEADNNIELVVAKEEDSNLEESEFKQ